MGGKGRPRGADRYRKLRRASPDDPALHFFAGIANRQQTKPAWGRSALRPQSWVANEPRRTSSREVELPRASDSN